MDPEIRNKLAPVTGSTAGIGYSIAEAITGAALRVDGGTIKSAF